LIYSEIVRRRKSGQRGDDILSLLLDTRDEDGDPLESEQIRDEVMTLLFAGHDTTASTTTFLFYELALRPEILHAPGVTPEMLREETLRKYPPAWVGPRRTNGQFEFAGHTVPAGAHCQYSSWVSHNLPDVWTDPASFDPYRFTSEGMAAMQKGQYVPFGGGSRTCIGMRFGEAEIGVFIRRLLERFRFELDPAYELEIRTAPTISPRRGMPMTVRSAEPAPVLGNTERPEAAPAGA
jgi:cytochrome P450